jgi:hypothetical protein
MVLIFGLSVAAALTVGVVFLEVTIDPVELWASPESRSRQEKDYFDKSFTPFYRTEQVILHAEGIEGVSLPKGQMVTIENSILYFFFFPTISLTMKHCRGLKGLDPHFN